MSNSILILGDSGTGKSTSLRNLPSEETFIINVVGKPLPFRGSSKQYTKLTEENAIGNYAVTDSAEKIVKIMRYVSLNRPEIKYLVLDDLGYVIMNSFMKNALQKGYDKYSIIGAEFAGIMDLINTLRDDLFVIAMMHIETDKQGRTKPKTVGAMIDQYICIEGKFTNVLHAHVTDGSYKFITNNDGVHMAKTSLGCFSSQLIDNDLLYVTDTIKNYMNEDIAQ